MAQLEIKARNVDNTNSNAQHMYWVYTNDNSEKYAFSGFAENNDPLDIIYGDIFIQIYSKYTLSRSDDYDPNLDPNYNGEEPPHRFMTVFTGSDAELAPMLEAMSNEAERINQVGYDYALPIIKALFSDSNIGRGLIDNDQNSNTVAMTLARVAGFEDQVRSFIVANELNVPGVDANLEHGLLTGIIEDSIQTLSKLGKYIKKSVKDLTQQIFAQNSNEQTENYSNWDEEAWTYDPDEDFGTSDWGFPPAIVVPANSNDGHHNFTNSAPFTNSARTAISYEIDGNQFTLNSDNTFTFKNQWGKCWIDKLNHTMLLDYFLEKEDQNYGYFGLNGNDVLLLYKRTNRIFIDGGKGNDVVIGGENDDILIGGKGVDILHGGRGNGNDLLFFDNDDRGNISLVAVNGGGGYDTAILTSLNENTKLYLTEDHEIRGPNDYITLAEIEVVHTQAGNDVIDAQDTKIGIKIYSGLGNDNLYGGSGNDLLSGGIGKDNLYGGKGNDTLQGGIGKDTYHYALGDGNDLIIDADGKNSLILENINTNHVTINRENDDIRITISNNDNILIKDQFSQSIDVDTTVTFDDGQQWSETYLADIAGMSPLSTNIQFSSFSLESTSKSHIVELITPFSSETYNISLYDSDSDKILVGSHYRVNLDDGSIHSNVAIAFNLHEPHIIGIYDSEGNLIDGNPNNGINSDNDDSNSYYIAVGSYHDIQKSNYDLSSQTLSALNVMQDFEPLSTNVI